MLELLKLYLVNILRPIFEDPQLFREDLLQEDTTDGDDCDSEPGVEQLDGDCDVRSQALSLNESGWNAGQATAGRPGYGKTLSGGKSRSKRARRQKRRKSGKRDKGLKEMGLLDLSGPKLIDGCRGWLLYFQIFGQLNWLNQPLYLSIIYKAAINALALYLFLIDFIAPTMRSNIIDSNYKNPIFVFIGLLASITIILHALITTYTNLFKLCPMFKVLTTPRLCFIKTEIQHIVGTKTIYSMTILFVYQCALLKLFCSNNFDEFLNKFSIRTFLFDIPAIICLSFYLLGTTQLDFYIRVCFGFWIIAMKTNLEYRFAYLQQHQRLVGLMNTSTTRDQRQSRQLSSSNRAKNVSSISIGGDATDRNIDGQRAVINEPSMDNTYDDARSNNSLETNVTNNTTSTNYNKRTNTAQSEQMTLNNFREKYKIDTMDEIQKSLNTMDDHLEVCREIQNSSLVLITLNAFLLNGACLLLAYNLLANRGDYYHGVIVILITLNNTFMVFLCYIGDSWISYALGSFVQTVEDEYFLQGGDSATGIQSQHNIDTIDGPKSNNVDPVLPLNWSIMRTKEPSETGSETMHSVDLIRQHQSLFLIKKEDVQFCREFLHQFKNHLATPWSKLTVKIHLNMLGTFVTLIAAQIIFDREH